MPSLSLSLFLNSYSGGTGKKGYFDFLISYGTLLDGICDDDDVIMMVSISHLVCVCVCVRMCSLIICHEQINTNDNPPVMDSNYHMRLRCAHELFD